MEWSGIEFLVAYSKLSRASCVSFCLVVRNTDSIIPEVNSSLDFLDLGGPEQKTEDRGKIGLIKYHLWVEFGFKRHESHPISFVKS